jgi:hypothetical protein
MRTTAFSARTVPVDGTFASDADVSPATKAILASAGIVPKTASPVDFGYNGSVQGTNTIAVVRVANAEVDDKVSLAPGTVATVGLVITNGTYAPPIPATPIVVNPTSLTFPYPGAPNQIVTASEANYKDVFVITTATCGSIASIAPTSSTGPFTFTPVGAGLCTASVKDAYTNSDNATRPVTVSVDVMGPLTVSPASLTFASPSAAAQTVVVSKTWDNQAISVSSAGCGGIVTATQGAQSAPSSPSASPSTTAVTIAPASAGSCTLALTDQYGETVTVAINVISIPQPPVPTPTAANGASVSCNAGDSWIGVFTQTGTLQSFAWYLGYNFTYKEIQVCGWTAPAWNCPAVCVVSTPSWIYDSQGGIHDPIQDAPEWGENGAWVNVTPATIETTHIPRWHYQPLYLTTDPYNYGRWTNYGSPPGAFQGPYGPSNLVQLLGATPSWELSCADDAGGGGE